VTFDVRLGVRFSKVENSVLFESFKTGFGGIKGGEGDRSERSGIVCENISLRIVGRCC
jgi:hypothetical protein